MDGGFSGTKGGKPRSAPCSSSPHHPLFFQREYNLGNQAAAAVQAVLRSFFTLA